MKHLLVKRVCCLSLALLLSATAWPRAAAAEQQEPLDRSETVYVTATASGEVSSVLSSVYIVNPDGREQLTDVSNLTDVHNILANETPKRNGDAWVFEADGEDVCYQGVSEGQLPFAMAVTYELDGETLTPEEIAGKSGHVRVTVTYTNELRNTVELGEETLSLYTPLNIVTIIALSDDFSSVQCTNAHLLSDAGSLSVFGITFPGMAENLDTDATDELSNSLSFEADVTSFELDSIMAVAMPDIFEDSDLSRLDELQSLVDGVDELEDSGNQLAYGASKLSSGLSTFADGVSEFAGSMQDLADQAASMGSMASGMESSLSGTVGQAASSIQGALTAIGQVQAGSADAVADQVVAAMGGELSAEQEAQLRSAITAAWNQQVGQMSSQLGEVSGQLTQLLGSLSTLQGVLGSLLGGVQELSSGLQALPAGMQSLNDGLTELVSGARGLSSGMRRFCNEGLAELSENTDGIALALDRKDSMQALAEAYTSFSGDPAASSGSVRFVVTTDSIYVPNVTPAPDAEQSPEPEEPAGFFGTIWNWISGLFGG